METMLTSVAELATSNAALMQWVLQLGLADSCLSIVRRLHATPSNEQGRRKRTPETTYIPNGSAAFIFPPRLDDPLFVLKCLALAHRNSPNGFALVTSPKVHQPRISTLELATNSCTRRKACGKACTKSVATS